MLFPKLGPALDQALPNLHHPTPSVWEVGCRQRSPPETGRLRWMLDMKSLPAQGLNIAMMEYVGDVYRAN